MIVRLGLMDQDERYLSRIAAFFSAHPEDTMQLELCLFSSVEECNAYLSANGRLDILLAAPELLPDPAALKKPTILAYLSEDKSMTAWAGCPAVCKYQKASAILRSIQGLAANIHNAGGSYDLGGGGRVVLFAGSAGGAGCSTAAMACAVHLAAQGRRTVYFSLQQNAQPELFFAGHGASMSDVHYSYQEWQRMAGGETSEDSRRSLQLKLKSMLATDEKTHVDSFAGFTLPLDAMDFDGAEAAGLIRALAAQYDCCVVDADGRLDDTLLQALPCAQWFVAVSDGTEKCNRALTRLLTSLRELNSAGDALLTGEAAVLYNRFGSQARPAADLPGYVQVLGQIPRYSNAAPGGIITEIASGAFFAALEA